MKRLLLLFLLLAALVIVPFLIWGGAIEVAMSPEKLVAAFQSSRDWAWLAGLGLLVIDLFLPVLGTAVMSALGLVYGWFVGGLLSALGSIGAGMLAYGLCFRLGRRAARWFAGEAGLEEGERLFRGELGGWLVALSRWMPVLPEVVACLAGIARMPVRRFFLALCAGSVPMGFVYAWIGHSGVQHPLFALGLSAGLPPLIWLGFRALYRAKAVAGDPQKQSGLPGSEPREAVKSDDSDTSGPPGIDQRRR
jgi:uncharacterized membrane protein YdjX (TVP38/TMEM64 family)